MFPLGQELVQVIRLVQDLLQGLEGLLAVGEGLATQARIALGLPAPEWNRI